MGASGGDALPVALNDALRPLRLGRTADAESASTSPEAMRMRAQSPPGLSSAQPRGIETPSPCPSSAPVTSLPGNTSPQPGIARSSAPQTVPRRPGGLRMLSLPTVGATQAAAEAAAAAMQQPRRDPELPDSGTSYFRRFSMLQRKSPALAAPSPQVLKTVDAVRGILFALSQIYSALKQYVGVVGDERLAGSFQRMLSGAGGALSSLINSLDAFDSQRSPEPQIVRGVLESARDGVIVFHRIVRSLSSHLDALELSVDARFSRTLLVMLYGSIAEVCNSAAALSANMHAIVPIIAQVPEGTSTSQSTLLTPVRPQPKVPQYERPRFGHSPNGEISLEDQDDGLYSAPTQNATPSVRTHKHKKLLSPGTSPNELRPSLAPSDGGNAAGSKNAANSVHVHPMTPSSSSIPSARTNSSSSLRDFRLSPGAKAQMDMSQQGMLPIDIHLLELLSQASERSIGVWSDVHIHSRARAATLDGVHYADGQGTAQPDVPMRRVHELGSLSTDVLDQARQLQDALSEFSWGSEGHAQRLWERADQFVRVRTMLTVHDSCICINT